MEVVYFGSGTQNCNIYNDEKILLNFCIKLAGVFILYGKYRSYKTKDDLRTIEFKSKC